MIDIKYGVEEVGGEPGPHLYWRGFPTDFLQAILCLRELGVKNGEQVNIAQLTELISSADIPVVAKSSSAGQTLVALVDNYILIDLDCRLWREVLFMFLSISFYPSHNYVEFDGTALVEEAHFIISSEKPAN